MGAQDEARPNADPSVERAVDQLQSDAELLKVIVDHTADSIVRFDRALRYDFVNDRAIQLTGIGAERFLGATQADLGYPPEEVEVREERISKVFASGDVTTYHDVIVNLEGERWYETTLLPQRDDTGDVTHVIVMSRDVTARKMAEDALVRAAARDPLTGLANRSALLEVLHHAIESSEDSRLTTAVLLIDLDRFKLVNDSLGHAVGDRLLCLAAERIRQNVRPEDLVARHGGDEYVVVMRDLTDPAEAVGVSLRIVEAFRQPLLSGETELSTTASVGISVTAPTRVTIDANDLIREADTAMYVAKANGRDGVSVFDEALRLEVDDRLRIENQLRGALGRGELAMWYQPEVHLRSGRIRSAEALLRWHHPSGEVLPAARFIDVAEDSGLIAPIGAWVLNEVVRQSAVWTDREVIIRLNLASRQLNDPDLLGAFDRAVARHQARADLLCVEITETTLLHDTPTATRNLKGLTARGVKVALDDFGTGYASLTYLRRYHIDVVKLDRSFVTDIDTSPRDQRLAAAVVAMAQQLDIRVTAEGVETRAQADVVRKLGCTGAQGYLWSPAVPPDEFERMITG
ncbi:MAG: EAL domain-containing protein [Microthrixaceae bacterium]|jgi:diguanylate cyclase (GGDEF)-like protein/PAS domain S-box-containing protein|nr:EAL domain-containing protein [Microthrixaceae bacterium]